MESDAKIALLFHLESIALGVEGGEHPTKMRQFYQPGNHPQIII